MQIITVQTDDKEELEFNSYPITVMSHYIREARCDAMKKPDTLKNGANERNGLIDKAKVKALEIKDSITDTSK